MLTQDIANKLNAQLSDDQHSIRVYVPSHDRDGQPVDQATWIDSVAKTLASVAGGVTVENPVRGGWLNKSTNRMIWESPVPVYAFLTASALSEGLPAIRRVVHQMGAETHQGEVGVEIDGRFALISNYDSTATMAA